MARSPQRSRNHPKSRLQRPGPAGGVRDRNRRDNLRRLSDAALELFLSDGTAAVTIDQIVGRADMAKGSFYRYVASKAELVEHILAPVADEVARALARCERALHEARATELAPIYMRLALELAEVVSRHGPRVLLYLQEVRAPPGGARAAFHALAEQLEVRAVALTETAIAHGLIRDVHPRVVALTVVGAVDTLLYAHLRGRLPIDVQTIMSELVTLVLRGVVARQMLGSSP
jgi:AcrR family transcriptional regulator